MAAIPIAPLESLSAIASVERGREGDLPWVTAPKLLALICDERTERLQHLVVLL